METETISTGTIPGADVPDFISHVHGLVERPGDPGYDQSRKIWNGLIDRRPEFIVHCTGVSDVIESVKFARDQGLKLSIRGGGHNIAGNAVNDGGLVIDLSSMRAVRVDLNTRTVHAQGGATWADVDRETQIFGLATPGGLVSITGIAGLTLHGGLGHLRRSRGLSIDNLVSVEIVTADGEVRHASEQENADLFWAVRGAGSNFGVVTWFEFKLHQVGPMVAQCVPVFALEDGAQAIRAWRDIVATFPDQVSSFALGWSVPDHEAFPEPLRRMPVVVIAAVYDGPPETGHEVMQPLRNIAGITPLMDLTDTVPYVHLQNGFDGFFPDGDLYYWKSTYIDDLPDSAIDTVIERVRLRPSNRTDLAIWQLGGAISKVATDATAFGRRNPPYMLAAESTWTDPLENDVNIAWSRETLDAMREYSHGGLYPNFPGFHEDPDALVRAAYGANYDRLVQVKTKYDPDNLFRMNLNIRPGV